MCLSWARTGSIFLRLGTAAYLTFACTEPGTYSARWTQSLSACLSDVCSKAACSGPALGPTGDNGEQILNDEVGDDDGDDEGDDGDDGDSWHLLSLSWAS